MKASESDLQRLKGFLADRALWELEEGTLVALPSVSLGAHDLISKMGNPQRFDERLLFLLLMLRSPRLELVYVSSQPLAEDVVSHCLRLLPDPADARRRLTLISLDDKRHKPLAQKLLANPGALTRIKSMVDDPAQACIVPMDVTPDELAIAGMLDLPVFGPAAEFAHLGTKSGSRMVARAAGVAVLPGRENLCHRQELRDAAAEIQKEVPGIGRVILKLDEGFSGEGNAVIDLTNKDSDVVLGGDALDWSGFLEKMQEGGVIEAFIEDRDLRCPSVQISVSPGGRIDILASQEQVLGGPSGQAFVGCRFPADEDYRAELHELSRSVARCLRDKGVHGIFGLDFLVHGAPGETSVYLCEINLRMGGATAPCFLARLLTGGRYDDESGLLRSEGREIRYLSREHVSAPGLYGRRFSDLSDQLESEGLWFDASTMSGVWPHVCTTLDRGEVGYVIFGPSEEVIAELDSKMLTLLSAGQTVPAS